MEWGREFGQDGLPWDCSGLQKPNHQSSNHLGTSSAGPIGTSQGPGDQSLPKPSAGSCLDVAHLLPGLSQLLCEAWSQARFLHGPLTSVTSQRIQRRGQRYVGQAWVPAPLRGASSHSGSSATDMPSRRRKTRKLRGHVSHGHGHGRIGKHRKHPGGGGNAGGLHHHRINFDKYHPGYFGKVGVRHYHLKGNQSFCPTVNLDELWALVSEQTGKCCQEQDWSCSYHGCGAIGYYRVLGKGKLPEQPVIVKAKFFSRRAEENMKGAGGACVLETYVPVVLRLEISQSEPGAKSQRVSPVQASHPPGRSIPACVLPRDPERLGDCCGYSGSFFIPDEFLESSFKLFRFPILAITRKLKLLFAWTWAVCCGDFAPP
ncbi:hypothetical protein QTO34_004493 [Cnephaeus nilssonii]|uniref:Large ribosomal subunit protein uL15 n=1 Tax=Cnephaeus nilssonii TaxID=3371016 RepID=A0AA40LIK6_CNENI|nr:hypothetical protein QTO34_004493 [Eptesicus nilssonii]